MLPPRMRRRGTDLPLANDPSSRFLSWLTALTVFLAVLALSAALLLAALAQRWDSGSVGGMTIQISAQAPIPADTPDTAGTGRPLPERLETALAMVRATPGVVSAEPLPADELARLLEPWLGAEAADPLLPMPVLIDVVTSQPIDVEPLAARLKDAGTGATVDDHAAWLADLKRFARVLWLTALAIVILIGGAGVTAVIFAVRASLAIHRHLVELLHLMGAPDRYVSRQFERHALKLTFRGGAIGLSLAAGAILALRHTAGSLFSVWLPDLSLPVWQWVLLPLVPLIACGLAIATTRWTVLRSLETMP